MVTDLIESTPAAEQTGQTTQAVLKGLLRAWLILIGLLILAAIIFRWDRAGSLQDVRMQVLLTVIGLAGGTWLAEIQSRAAGRFRKTALVSIVTIAFSQICYLILVWTSWKMHPLVWRFWWVSLVAAVTSTHVVWLRCSAAPDRRMLMRCTIGFALFAAAMLASLGFYRTIPPTVDATWIWLVSIASVFSGIGSIILWLRNLRQNGLHVPRAVKTGWIVLGQAAVASIAFYAGRITAPQPAMIDRGPSALSMMRTEELNLQIGTDLARLRIIASGLDDLEKRADALSVALRSAREQQRRDRYTPQEDDQVRGMFMSYLAYREALLRMVAMYAGFDSVRDPDTRARSMMMTCAAASIVFESSLKLVSNYRDDGVVRLTLNEADSRWGLPAGMFDRIQQNVSNPRNSESLAEVRAYIEANQDEWLKRGIFPAADLAWIRARIEKAGSTIAALGPGVAEPRWKQILAQVKHDTYTPWYATQSIVSTWIGDTRLIKWQPFIEVEQIKQMQARLKSGDILLERRNWFLSNAFLPGFWPHAALYIGTPQDLEKLGLLRRSGNAWVGNHPEITDDRLKKYLEMAADGEPHTVIEAISDGVIFNSLTESMHADYVAALRPRVSDQQKAEAIARAFSHLGKPYDFEFDFATSGKLVCTELVYRSYAGALNLEEPYMQKIMGRSALPALEFARKFREERAAEARQLDFVLFLDGDPLSHSARVADESAFCSTVDRPRAFNE